MGKLTTWSLVACVGLFGIAGCDDPEPFVPPGGVDAPPRADAGPDGPTPDGPLVSTDAPPAAGPPVITLLSPMNGALISGIMQVEVMVEDVDGVTTVSTTIAGAHTIVMAPVTVGSSTYVGLFDTRVLAGLVAPTVIVRAVDTTNATAQLGFQIALDNQPPIASLDPANVRQIDRTKMPEECSRAFDPLGTDAPSDGQAVPQLIELRARVADLSNTGTLDTTLFVQRAGVQSVRLWVLDDTTKPLVVDTNGDGICDAINPMVIPSTVPMFANEAAVLDLAAVAPGGSAWFGSTTFGGSNITSCSAGTDAEAPASSCLGEPSVTTIIKSPFTGTSEIYGMPPVTALNCMGFALDAVATNIADGWACAAVATTDTLGNRSVSAPLRICVDADGNQAECGPWRSIAPSGQRPNCTGTVVGGVVTATPCTPRDFYRSATANEFELIDR